MTLTLGVVPDGLQLADEPTSGLDPCTSLALLRFLRQVLVEPPHVCVTIMVIIHQPRSEIMDCFDHLVMLAPHRHKEYYWQGPPSAVVKAVGYSSVQCQPAC